MAVKKGFPGKLPGFLRGKIRRGKAAEEADKAVRFLFLAFASLLVLFILTSLVPLEYYELFVANTVLSGLNSAGINGAIEYGEPIVIRVAGGPGIQISYLCTGVLEAVLLAGVIIASAGIPIRKRLIGVALGVAATMAVNFARIFLTIYFIYNSPIETVDLIHNVLFRLTLFVTVFALYALWFCWATGTGLLPAGKTTIK